MKKIISLKNVTKRYKLYEGMKERMLDLITPKSYGEDFYALRDVSLEAYKGDAIGFIGINGSGKSTLSNIIAGIVPETSGIVEVSGQAALIAVAAGLKGDLTGRDNIELKCLMLGLNKTEIEALEPSIIEFSELGKFIDQPVKSYSSGMKSRLGFSISVNIDPDILIIDEALSVGDRAFAEKSLNKMKEFKEQGKTMIFVSHSIGQMKQFCEKILWLEFGMVKAFGPVDEVIPEYELFLKHWQKMTKEERDDYKRFTLQGDQKNLDKLMDTSNKKVGLNISGYLEQSISLLGHLKSRSSFLYASLKNILDKQASDDYKDSVYYIKRKAILNGQTYYLLSTKPSTIKGVIGWMKKEDLSTHLHIVIDEDPKAFILTGSGAGYTDPWGGKKNCLYSDLSFYEGHKFLVNKTETVGNNTWYRGLLNDQQVWIHHSDLKYEV